MSALQQKQAIEKVSDGIVTVGKDCYALVNEGEVVQCLSGRNTANIGEDTYSRIGRNLKGAAGLDYLEQVYQEVTGQKPHVANVGRYPEWCSRPLCSLAKLCPAKRDMPRA